MAENTGRRKKPSADEKTFATLHRAHTKVLEEMYKIEPVIANHSLTQATQIVKPMDFLAESVKTRSDQGDYEYATETTVWFVVNNGVTISGRLRRFGTVFAADIYCTNTSNEAVRGIQMRMKHSFFNGTIDLPTVAAGDLGNNGFLFVPQPNRFIERRNKLSQVQIEVRVNDVVQRIFDVFAPFNLFFRAIGYMHWEVFCELWTNSMMGHDFAILKTAIEGAFFTCDIVVAQMKAMNVFTIATYVESSLTTHVWQTGCCLNGRQFIIYWIVSKGSHAKISLKCRCVDTAITVFNGIVNHFRPAELN